MGILHKTLGGITALTFAFLVWLVLAGVASAQTQTQYNNQTGTQTGTETTTAASPDSECPGAHVVQTTRGTGNKQTAPFQVTGDRFRVTTNIRATGDPSFMFFSADVKRQGGNTETTIDREQPGTDTSIVNAGPGTFFLDILAANIDYTITVEDCSGSAGAGSGNVGTGSIAQDNLGGSTDPASAQDNVIRSTIPDRALPFTGGIPLLPIAGGVLLATGLVLMRKVYR